MATLTVQAIDRDGLDPSFAAADVAGDEFDNAGKEFFAVRNNDASAITVTLNIQAQVDGQAVTGRTVNVPGSGGERWIGPFKSGQYNDGNGRVQITYSAVASVTVAAFQLTNLT